MEKQQKIYENVRLVNNKKDFLKCTSKPTDIIHKIFYKNYAAIHEIKPVLTLKKTIQIGFTVPELSRWLMYDFHYNFIKKYFGAELLFADRYSLTYEIKSEDVYKEVFNTSTCLISVTIQKIQIFLILPIKKVVGK